MFIGILYGLGAATAQSFSYLFSRHFVAEFRSNAMYLLTLSHFIMGWFSLLLLYIIWPEKWPAFGDYALFLLGATVFYLFGQASLFLALQISAASRASPLLGLKVFILAIISVIFFNYHLNPCQWMAVVISVIAAIMLNWSGGSMPWQSVMWILSACLGYSLSDLNIKELVECFSYLGLTHAAALSVCLSYLLCGLISIFFLLFLKHTTLKMWIHSLPYSVSWFIAMMLLFACFGSIGVVFGNIVQSSRGIISIAIGSLVAAAGYVHLEDKVKTSVFVRRILAAVLMAAAIAIFYLSQQ